MSGQTKDQKQPLTVPSGSNPATFMQFEQAGDLGDLQADIAIIGIPHGQPYAANRTPNDQSNGPAAIRAASRSVSGGLERWDFDLDGPLFDGRDMRVVDCGDVCGDPSDADTHYRHAEQAVRLILRAGAVPIVLGGDHGIPIPVLRAFDDKGPITLVQIDAHIDWIDEKFGVREGYSSPIRRASEMDHVGEIFQIGLRSQGSARKQEVEAAKAYGAHLITDAELQATGMDAVLDRIPDGGNFYITMDADGFDPAVMPAVAGPAPGGVTYLQACRLIAGLAEKGRIVGVDMVEITPSRDVNQITAITAGRLIANVIGRLARVS